MIIVMHSTYKFVYYKQAYICMYNTCNYIHNTSDCVCKWCICIITTSYEYKVRVQVYVLHAIAPFGDLIYK